MKHINFLTFAASIAFTAFIITLCFGLISMPVFLISSVAWIALLTVHSYSMPARSILPRSSRARLMAELRSGKVELPLAA